MPPAQTLTSPHLQLCPPFDPSGVLVLGSAFFSTHTLCPGEPTQADGHARRPARPPARPPRTGHSAGSMPFLLSFPFTSLSTSAPFSKRPISRHPALPKLRTSRCPPFSGFPHLHPQSLPASPARYPESVRWPLPPEPSPWDQPHLPESRHTLPLLAHLPAPPQSVPNTAVLVVFAELGSNHVTPLLNGPQGQTPPWASETRRPQPAEHLPLFRVPRLQPHRPRSPEGGAASPSEGRLGRYLSAWLFLSLQLSPQVSPP